MGAEKPKIIPLSPIVSKETFADSVDAKLQNTVANLRDRSEDSLAELQHVWDTLTGYSDSSIGTLNKANKENIARQDKILKKWNITPQDFGEILIGKEGGSLALLGADTTKAVLELQTVVDMNVNDRDGILGPKTLAYLHDFANANPESPTFANIPGRIDAINRAYDSMTRNAKGKGIVS